MFCVVVFSDEDNSDKISAHKQMINIVFGNILVRVKHNMELLQSYQKHVKTIFVVEI